MTNNEIFNLLFNGGNFVLPYLLKFTHISAGSVLLVNNNEDIVFNGETYHGASVTYTPPNNDGTSGSLTIDSVPGENNLFEFLENADENYRLDVVGTILQDGTIQTLKQYKHFYGSISVDEKGTIEFQLGSDDRLDMMFTPYKFDTDNNPGNA